MDKINEILLPLKEQWNRKQYPSFPDVEHTSIVYGKRAKKYTDQNTNGLTECIIDYVKFIGGFANRINTQGTWDKRIGKYRRATTQKGTPDIDIIYNSKPIKVEVKCAATKDTLKQHQKDIHQKLRAAGAIVYIATDFIGFYTWFNQFKTPSLF